MDFIQILHNEILWLESLFLLRVFDMDNNIIEISGEELIKRFPSVSSRISDNTQIAPELNPKISLYANFVVYNKLSLEERLLLILSLCTHVRPSLIEEIFHEHKPNGEQFFKNSDVGGIKGENFRGIFPTGLTWLFLVSGRDFIKRSGYLQFLIRKSSPVFELKVVNLINNTITDPVANGQLTISDEYLHAFILNELPDKK